MYATTRGRGISFAIQIRRVYVWELPDTTDDGSVQDDSGADEWRRGIKDGSRSTDGDRNRIGYRILMG